MRGPKYLKHLFFNSFLLLALAPLARAQQLPNFPYSALGVGEYDYHAQGLLSGMGYGVSAVRSTNFINNTNPAGYSAFHDKLVLAEISATGRNATLENGQATSKSSDFNVSRFAIGVKVSKFWGSSVGLLPLTTVKYQIVAPKTITGSTQDVSSIYEGNGGLHQFYWGNGFRIGKHFSVGAQLNYIFGSINESEKTAYDISSPVMTATRQTYLRNLNFSYGAQFFSSIGKKLDFTLAMQYQSRRPLRASYTVNIINAFNDTLSTKNLSDNYFTIPDEYRGGIAFTYDQKLTVDFDYIFSHWNNETSNNSNVRLVNGNAYGLGLAWHPGGSEASFSDKALARMVFEGGMNYDNTYLQISGRQVRDISFSLGAGFSNRSRNISVSLGFAFGQKGNPAKGFITENYTNFYCSLILRNIWFIRDKYF